MRDLSHPGESGGSGKRLPMGQIGGVLEAIVQASCGCVHIGQRRAETGISETHSVQVFVVGADSIPR